MSHLAQRVRHWWDGDLGRLGRAAGALAWPLELAYAGAIGLRARAFENGWLKVHELPVPVVSVGNLVVGGTGKTPVAAWLVGQLAAWGRRPALVARGYGADERLLHERWHPDVPVHTDPDRVRAAWEAERSGADVLVLDDGFQHRRLGRDADLVLVAAEHQLPGRLLPRGPYREPVRALRRATAVLVTWRVTSENRAHALADLLVARLGDIPVGTVHLAPDGWADLYGRPASPPAEPMLAVCSIAEPDGFRTLVERVSGSDPRLLAFPDHHSYTAQDVDAILQAAAEWGGIVVTEKDAVKLLRWSERLQGARVLHLRVDPGPGAEQVLRSVRQVVEDATSRSLGPGSTESYR